MTAATSPSIIHNAVTSAIATSHVTSCHTMYISYIVQNVYITHISYYLQKAINDSQLRKCLRVIIAFKQSIYVINS